MDVGCWKHDSARKTRESKELPENHVRQFKRIKSSDGAWCMCAAGKLVLVSAETAGKNEDEENSIMEY